MAEWWSIEVFSGDKLPASGWRYAYEDELTEAAITHGALYYEWHDTQYGVIFEVLFPSDEQWEAFRALPGQPKRVGQVPGHLTLRDQHAAADRDDVPPSVRCHAWHASPVTTCKQTRDCLAPSNTVSNYPAAS